MSESHHNFKRSITGKKGVKAEKMKQREVQDMNDIWEEGDKKKAARKKQSMIQNDPKVVAR